MMTAPFGLHQISEGVFIKDWGHFLDPDIYRGANSDVYRRILGIEDIQSQVGSDETGWVFR